MSTEPADQRAHSVHLNPAFRQIIDNLPAFVWCAAPDGAIAYLNRRGLEYTGFSLEQVTGWDWKETNILHADDGDALFDAWNAIVASGREGEIEARMRRFDGEYRWFLFRVAPQFDEAGTLTAWWGVDVEIDERKRAETLLTGEKRLLEMMASGDALTPILETVCTLVESSAPGCFCSILLVDPTGRCLHHGAAPSLPSSYTDAIHGRPVDPDAGPCGMAAFVKGQVVAADIASDTRWGVCEWGALALGHGLKACWSTPILSHGGLVLGTFALYWRRPVVPDGKHQTLIERLTHLAAVAIQRSRDVTDRQRSEDALHQVRSDLAHVTRVTTLGEMTASIAHEINQPLGAIVNNASAALRWLSADEIENARLSMALVVADGHRASEILQRVRAMVQKSPPHKQPVDLNDAVREVLMLVASQAARHGVSIESRLADGMPAVDADRVQIQQVVLNLVMNAIEAMSAIPADLRQVTVASSCDGDTAVHVSIHDQGAGFSPEESERLFEPFYSTKLDGLGMGLAISRGIVQAHRGELWATANTNGGATFEFTLPLATRES